MSPFLCSIIILASFHSTGIFLSLKFAFCLFVICLTDSSPPSIISLVGSSMLRALLFLISFGVFLTSDVMVGGTSDESGLVFFCEVLVLDVELEVQKNTGIPVRTGVSRAYRYGSAVRYVPVHSGVFGSLYGNCRSIVTRHCLTSV